MDKEGRCFKFNLKISKIKSRKNILLAVQDNVPFKFA